MDTSHGDTSFAPKSPDLTNVDFYAADSEPLLPQHQHYHPSVSHHPPYTPGGYHPAAAAYHHNQTVGYAPPILQQPMPPRRPKREFDDDEYDPVPQTPLESTERLKRLNMEGNGGDYSGGPVNVDLGINVKTKFPVARIKRIMQADDDVGKVAQVTPVAVSKALELFMINLVTKAATEAKSRNQKRVAATHLKQAITQDKQFDFLEEIVSKVADAPPPAEKDSDDAPEPKKRKGSSRRKKKEDSEDI